MRNVLRRWKYHLNAVVLLVPLALVPDQFGSEGQPPSMVPHPIERSVGPWQVSVIEVTAGLPEQALGARGRRDFALSFRAGYPDRIRAAFVRIGKPRDIKNAGTPAKGNPFRLQARVPVPPETKADESVWLTVEGWDGSIHQTSWPLSDMTAVQ